MAVELWLGQEFDTSHERKTLEHFMNNMRTRFQESSSLYLVLANYFISSRQIDLTVLKQNAIIVVELKECKAPLQASENGPWTTIPEGQIIGTGQQNPFEQTRGYRFKWVNFLSEHGDKFMPSAKAQSLAASKAIYHVSAFVAISPRLHPDSENLIQEPPWFRLVGLDQLPPAVHQQVSADLNFSETELKTLVRDVLRLKPVTTSWDSHERGVAQRSETDSSAHGSADSDDSSPDSAAESASSNTNYLSLRDAAFLLGISYREVYELARTGQIRSQREEGQLKLPESSVLAYKESQEPTSSPSDLPACARCGRVIRSAHESFCQHPGCDQPLCDRCWASANNRYCLEHTSESQEPELASSDSGKILSKGQMLQNRYQFVRPLKEGGYGAVYEGFDTRLSKVVAIKKLVQSGPKSHRAFEREAHTLANLSHPGLPRVIDYFLENGHYYLVMNYVTGTDLDEWIKTKGPVSDTQAVAWARQVLETLVYLHESGVIHRDLKPANIIVEQNSRRAILIDLGIAKIAEHTYPLKARSHYYSPPEQTSDEIGPQADLYSLGAILYFLLTGQPPPDAFQRGADDTLLALSDYNTKIRLSTERVILKALAVHPKDRWQSATEMLHELQNSPSDIPTGQTA